MLGGLRAALCGPLAGALLLPCGAFLIGLHGPRSPPRISKAASWPLQATPGHGQDFAFSRDQMVKTTAGVALGLLGGMAIGGAPDPAVAWCGRPFPPWAYYLKFNEGLMPFECQVGGETFKGDLFLRVVGDPKKEKKVSRPKLGSLSSRPS
jgi:hypothetical protein